VLLSVASRNRCANCGDAAQKPVLPRRRRRLNLIDLCDATRGVKRVVAQPQDLTSAGSTPTAREFDPDGSRRCTRAQVWFGVSHRDTHRSHCGPRTKTNDTFCASRFPQVRPNTRIKPALRRGMSNRRWHNGITQNRSASSVPQRQRSRPRRWPPATRVGRSGDPAAETRPTRLSRAFGTAGLGVHAAMKTIAPAAIAIAALLFSRCFGLNGHQHRRRH
jgi:hypothetical protein